MELLTKKQLADRLKICPKTVDRYCKLGKIRKLSAGDNTRAVRFDPEEVKKVFKHLKN